MFTKAIVRPPSRNFADGLTTAGLGAPDYDLALEQHAAYCVALEQCGLELIRLDADEQFPDSCFVEDAAVIPESPADCADYADSKSDDLRAAPKQAILTRPGAPSRRGEIASMRTALSRLSVAIEQIRSPGTVDGGDVCQAGTNFFIGISERTNEQGAQQLAEILVKHGLTSSFVDIRTHAPDAPTTSLLHLKSGLAYLGNNTLVVSEALARREEFRGYNLIEIDPREEYAANCIDVNGRVLIAEGHPRFAARLDELSYERSVLDMSEFQKMDGGLSCLSLRW